MKVSGITEDQDKWIASFKKALKKVNNSSLADLGGEKYYKESGSDILLYVMSDRCIDLEEAEGILEDLEVLFKKWFNVTTRVETKMITAKGKA